MKTSKLKKLGVNIEEPKFFTWTNEKRMNYSQVLNCTEVVIAEVEIFPNP